MDQTIEWICYILLSASGRRTYIGKTNNPHRRLRQHNGEIAGGAKATRTDRPWSHICLISGFKSEKEALRFEYMLKHFKRSRNRFTSLNAVLQSDRLYDKLDDPILFIYVKEKYYDLIEDQDHISIATLD
jgi:predicted GIY-YIG superfamily endonuclease